MPNNIPAQQVREAFTWNNHFREIDAGGCCRIVPKPNATHSTFFVHIPHPSRPHNPYRALFHDPEVGSDPPRNCRHSPECFPAVLLSAIHDEGRLKKQANALTPILHSLCVLCVLIPLFSEVAMGRDTSLFLSRHMTASPVMVRTFAS